MAQQGILRLARRISQLENGPVSQKALAQLTRSRKKSFLIGITGAAGAGKSTLSARLIRSLKSKQKIAYIGCDPSSPYSGGAFLGDRVRMTHTAGPGIFIRSMATRETLGGLSQGVAPACGALAKAGYNPILIESVGVGQTDIAIRDLVDLVIMVLTPEFGDSIQLSKAGLIEIADIYVINKSDQPNAIRAEEALLSALTIGGKKIQKPVLTTVATRGMGMETLAKVIKERMKRK